MIVFYPGSKRAIPVVDCVCKKSTKVSMEDVVSRDQAPAQRRLSGALLVNYPPLILDSIPPARSGRRGGIHSQLTLGMGICTDANLAWVTPVPTIRLEKWFVFVKRQFLTLLNFLIRFRAF